LIYIYLIHTVKTGGSLSTQVKLKFLFSIRQADLLNIALGMEMKMAMLVVLLCTPRMNLQNFKCIFSHNDPE
jgi:hypothetical protein